MLSYRVLSCLILYYLITLSYLFAAGYKRVWHSGRISTHKTQVWLYPDVGVGLFLSISGPPTAEASSGIRTALYYLSDLLIGEETWINTTTVCQFPEPWDEVPPSYDIVWPTDTPTRPYSDFVGIYSNPGFCDMAVWHNTSSNTLELHMGLYLVADLLYDRSMDVFYTKIKGVLWYVEDKIPVRFLQSSAAGGGGDGGDVGTIEQLALPLHTPYDSVKPVVFQRRLWDGTDYKHCNSLANKLDTSSSILYRVSCLVFLTNLLLSGRIA